MTKLEELRAARDAAYAYAADAYVAADADYAAVTAARDAALKTAYAARDAAWDAYYVACNSYQAELKEERSPLWRACSKKN